MLKLEYMPLDKARAAFAPDNPKDHDIPLIIDSFKRFGQAAPPIWDERTGFLGAGHGRVEALLKMKNDGDQPPANIEITKAGDWRVPVVRGWQSKDDAEAAAYRIADNQLTIVGGWVEADLVNSLARIQRETGSFSGIGYTEEQLNDLMANLAKQHVSFDAMVGSTPFDGVNAYFEFAVRADTTENRDALKALLAEHGFEFEVRVVRTKDKE